MSRWPLPIELEREARAIGVLTGHEWTRIGGGLHLARIDSKAHAYQLTVCGTRGAWSWQVNRWPRGMPQGSKHAAIATGEADSLREAQDAVALAAWAEIKRGS